jgi:hypothetical protein
MIDAARIDCRAAVEQEVGNCHGLGLVQRLLAVAAACVDERRVGFDHRPQLVDPSEARRHIGGQRRTTRERPASGRPRRPGTVM